MGYEIHPEMAVEMFTFDGSGRYTIEVRIAETTGRATFDRAEAEFDDGTTRITTFEITGPSTIQVREPRDP